MEALKWAPNLKERQNDVGYNPHQNFLDEDDSPDETEFHDFQKIASTYSESGYKKSEQVAKRTIELDYEYKGERFKIYRKNGLIYISHPKWSLVGMGDTLLKAELDMLEDAKLIADEYINQPDTELSTQAIKFKQYLLKII